MVAPSARLRFASIIFAPFIVPAGTDPTGAHITERRLDRSTTLNLATSDDGQCFWHRRSITFELL